MMPGGLNVNNPPKAYIVILALVCITVLMITDTVAAESGLGLLGLIVGYAVGNGIAAKADQPIEPILGHGHRDKTDEGDDAA